MMEPRDFEDSGRMRYGGDLVQDKDDKLRTGELVHGGKYRVESLLGRGGMALVYVARRVSDETEVALKVLREKYAKRSDVAYRLRTEVELARELADHPNVVNTLEVGNLAELAGAPFMVTELIDGTALTGVIIRSPIFSTERACRIALDLARALEAMAARGIVHRDVKPDNVMVLHEDTPHEISKLIDFGLAARARAPGDGSSRVTEVFERPGTRLYMAPEQAVGAPAAPSMDVYALGCTLHEMLTGAPPYGRRLEAELMARKVDGAQPEFSITEARRDLPPAVVAVVDACLIRDPAKRITATELRARLEAVIAELAGGSLREHTEVVGTAGASLGPVSAPTGVASPPPGVTAIVGAPAESRTGMTVIVPTPTVASLPPGVPTRAEALARIDEIDGSEPNMRAGRGAMHRPSRGGKTVILLGIVAAVAVLAFAFWPREPAPGSEAPLRGAPTEIKPAGTAPAEVPETPIRATPGAVPEPSRDAEDPPKSSAAEVPSTIPQPSDAGSEPSEAKAPEVPSVASSRPSKIKPSPAVPRTSPADDAACKAMREEAERARDALDAATVVAKTASKRCWSDGAARLRLRVPALFALSRYDDCAREGKASSDARVVRFTEQCKRKLEAP